MPAAKDQGQSISLSIVVLRVEPKVIQGGPRFLSSRKMITLRFSSVLYQCCCINKRWLLQDSLSAFHGTVRYKPHLLIKASVPVWRSIDGRSLPFSTLYGSF